MEEAPAAETLADLLPYLLAIVALALLMTYFMVQWSWVVIYLTVLRLPASREVPGDALEPRLYCGLAVGGDGRR